MTDYEDALFHALSVNYPNVRAVGCMFHHDQALYKTGILKNGLSDLYLTNREFRNWAELLLSLPLLPSNKIVDIYQYLKHKKPILSQIDDEKLAKLFRYYRNTGWDTLEPREYQFFKVKSASTMIWRISKGT